MEWLNRFLNVIKQHLRTIFALIGAISLAVFVVLFLQLTFKGDKQIRYYYLSGGSDSDIISIRIDIDNDCDRSLKLYNISYSEAVEMVTALNEDLIKTKNAMRR